MDKKSTLLYACCPVCCKPIGRSRSCDGMEIKCQKCGSPLRLSVDPEYKVIVEIVPQDQDIPFN